jgi:phage shock protein PspC (stress-responsive transcriptional regulator)
MSRRLTDDDRRYRAMTEAQFQGQVTGLAQLLGWHWVHVGYGPRLNRSGGVARYTTPTTGTMAKGWPDLVLVRPRDRRLIFAEVKRETGTTSPEQESVLSVLRGLCGPIGVAFNLDVAVVEVFVWRPSDIDTIASILA